MITLTVTLLQAACAALLVVASYVLAVAFFCRFMMRPGSLNRRSIKPEAQGEKDSLKPNGSAVLDCNVLYTTLGDLDARLRNIHDHVEWLATDRMVEVAAEFADSAEEGSASSFLLSPIDASSQRHNGSSDRLRRN